jgi:glycerol-3-phosphate dehydrogenase
LVTDNEPVDLLVIGGGINGAGIARDAAGRGLSVVLCEKDDLASATSSSSSKLIHGGLRYLEYYEFRLVREALIEREVLLRAAPHIIRPLRFVLPHDRGQRPAWMIRLGLFLYDHLGGRERLPGCETLALREDPAGQPLKSSLTKGFSYSDCWVDDARLVILNALDAKERGAEILTRARCIGARRVDGLWEVELEPSDGVDHGRGVSRRLRARAVVNAAGPWVAETLQQIAGVNRRATLRLVKGSHIVVPRLHDGPQAYILQNTDRRVIFVIPYEGRYSLIGTTDLPYEGDPGLVAITDDEVGYLCAAVDRYFERPVDRTQVAWSYAGVRPLYDDANQNVSAVTRDYVFDIDGGEGEAPLLSVYGGKITTYRKLAEHALAKLQPMLDFNGTPWTEKASLPGGDMVDADFERFLEDLQRSRPWLPAALAHRYARAYGTRVERLLDGRDSLDALGEDLGGGLHEAEVQYLVESEWAGNQDDILWRRSKLGLHVSKQTQERLADWFGQSDPSERQVATR